MTKPGEMYLYYSDQEVLPTYCKFKSRDELMDYVKIRKDLIVDKLNIPIQFFNNREVLEVGPDSGENSLVFAKWGSQLTLVEPNFKAIIALKDNFKNFGCTDKINLITHTDILSFDSDKKFDFIIAEGFLSTVKPYDSWLRKFYNLLNEDGLLLISYVNLYGSVMDLLYGVMATFVKNSTGSDLDYENTLKNLFFGKWNSIPHTRSFDSWKMDVLENPYNRLEYFINPAELVKEAANNSLFVYSSWPNYKSKNDIYWHKVLISDDEKLKSNVNTINYDQLSYFLGYQYFYKNKDDFNAVNQKILSLLKSIDHCNVTFQIQSLNNILQKLNDLLDLLKVIGIDDAGIFSRLECLNNIVKLMKKSDINLLIDFCNNDREFIDFWGMTTHILVLKKDQR